MVKQDECKSGRDAERDYEDNQGDREPACKEMEAENREMISAVSGGSSWEVGPLQGEV